MTDTHTIIFRTLSEIEPEEIPWLWPGRIPSSMLTLIVGDPDQGKSYLALDLAARVSRGGAWPDGGQAPQGRVILLADEDHAASVIRPRMDKLGGESKYIRLLEAVRDETQRDRPFRLDRDLVRLSYAMEGTNYPLVIIDPVNNYLGRVVDPNMDSEIRSILMPLALLAKERKAAVVGTVHLTKNTERLAVHRVLGSIGYVGVARSVFAVASDPTNRTRHIFSKAKLNIAGAPPSLAYTITDDGLAWEPDPVDVDIEALMRGDEHAIDHDAPERDRAKDLLLLLLADGKPVQSAYADKQRAEANISRRTWFRARTELGVKAVAVGFPPVWMLTLSNTVS